MRGSSLRQLSIANGLAPNTLQRSLYKRYPKAQAIIARFIGVPREVLWPQWYGDGNGPAGSQAEGA
jgi:lambda repressor-like predicted transcriptional regulator